MNQYLPISEIVSSYKCQSRVKLKNRPDVTAWASWFIVPSVGYIELSSCGPVSIKDIEWIDINPIVLIHIGRLVRDKQMDYRKDIELQLASFRISSVVIDGLIRVYSTSNS